jgi:hypothetical protein
MLMLTVRNVNIKKTEGVELRGIGKSQHPIRLFGPAALVPWIACEHFGAEAGLQKVRWRIGGMLKV